MVLLLHRCPQVQASASLRVEVFPSVLLVLLLVLVVLALALLVVSPRKVAFLQAELRRAFLAVAVLLQVLVSSIDAFLFVNIALIYSLQLVSLLQVSLRAVRLVSFLSLLLSMDLANSRIAGFQPPPGFNPGQGRGFPPGYGGR